MPVVLFLLYNINSVLLTLLTLCSPIILIKSFQRSLKLGVSDCLSAISVVFSLFQRILFSCSKFTFTRQKTKRKLLSKSLY